MALTRRDCLAGLLAAGMAPPALAAAAGSPEQPVPALRALRRTIEVNGRAAGVFGIAGPDGRPGLELVLGERFRARLHNETGIETLVHWHGLTPPVEQDGVPMLSQPVLKPGHSYNYDFASRRAGTFWMHSHVGLQEQQMLAAPLIIRETATSLFDQQQHVVMLHDFTFRDPEEILAGLKQGGGGHAAHGTMAGNSTMEQGQVSPAGPLNDITFDAYLANDRTPADPEVVQVEKGGTLRLRIINAAAASNMWIDLGALEGELIAVDGNAIYPFPGSLFPLAVAQRADIRIVIPAAGGAFPILFRPEGVAAQAAIILATAGASVARLAAADTPAPALDLGQELLYRAVAKLPEEPVTRTEMLMLTGGGSDYSWGLNGKAGMHETIFTVREGERIAVMMHNMTTMAHPMHLHGHYFKVTAIGNQTIDGAIRDVVLVPPGQSVTVMFDADNPGVWAFHCHHIYHMNAGMMGAIAYSRAA